jgi:hypothetical protein
MHSSPTRYLKPGNGDCSYEETCLVGGGGGAGWEGRSRKLEEEEEEKDQRRTLKMVEVEKRSYLCDIINGRDGKRRETK